MYLSGGYLLRIGKEVCAHTCTLNIHTYTQTQDTYMKYTTQNKAQSLLTEIQAQVVRQATKIHRA